MVRKEHREQMRNDRLEQRMVQDAAQKAAIVAAKEAAQYTATRVAKKVEQEILIKMQDLPAPQTPTQQPSQKEAEAPHPAVQPPPTITNQPRKRVNAHPPGAHEDLVSVQQADHSVEKVAESVKKQKTQAKRDPEIKAMMAQIAKLKATLSEKSKPKAQQAKVEADDLLAKVEADNLLATGAQMKIQRVAPKVPDPAATVPEDTSVVKQLSSQDKTIEAEEGGEAETQAEAENHLLYYAIWGSVGALVVGLFATVIYCACQQPRDRPWGMPPKRQY